MKGYPRVTQTKGLAMQVCVPSDYTDEEVVQFAEQQNPCGTMNGWAIQRKDENYKSYIERVDCSERPGYVHIVLVA